MKRLKNMWTIYKAAKPSWLFVYAFAISFLFISSGTAVADGTWPVHPLLNFLLMLIMLPVTLWAALFGDMIWFIYEAIESWTVKKLLALKALSS